MNHLFGFFRQVAFFVAFFVLSGKKVYYLIIFKFDVSMNIH